MDEENSIVGNIDPTGNPMQVALQAQAELNKHVDQGCVASVQQCADELLSYKHEYHRMMKVRFFDLLNLIGNSFRS